MSNEVLKWLLYTAVPAVLAAISYVWRRKRRRAHLIAFLKSLPPNCQGVLGEFVRQRSHTVVLPPNQSPIILLENHGIISKAGSTGRFDAVAYYFRLRPDVYQIVTDEMPPSQQ